jgi:tetratricopeptide (TPR) repeat protein
MSRHEAYAYKEIAFIYYQKKNYNASIEYYLNAIEIYDMLERI